MAPPGDLALFGSGETSPAGRRVHQHLFERLGRPVDVAILDTPAGFETNAARVVGRIKQFLEQSLRNFEPSVELVHAPRAEGRGTNDATALAGMLQANYLFAGPGSPSYAVSHLRGSLALRYLAERWRAGATVAAASAAAIAFGRWALPVYEIFKAGHDPHWLEGLDLLGSLGYRLAVVPHWNNREGGDDFDSARCYVGLARFEQLKAQLPPDATILGIDEQTACVMEFGEERGVVIGTGSVTIERSGRVEVCRSGDSFPLARLLSS
ncbi:MAG TPA: cysteinyl-tRNA synthetase [Chloroflexota bacterium]|jgi:cyanophycinase-like exopeptidase|nr:cysteinyl-tRNA synthetase [Chloroflexota bacterium]